MARGLDPDDLLPLVDALAPGEWVSGERLAPESGVGRAALSKRVAHLRRWGLEVEGHAGRGYRLARPLERLSEARIRAGLPPPWPDLLTVHVVPVCASTNTCALEAARAEDPQAWLAEMQTAGRGRRGRQWASPFAANLYLSLAWTFPTWPNELPSLSLVVGVALTRALEALGVAGAGLKWPNDVLWSGRKLAGILVEPQGEVHAACRTVIGVGVNIDMQEGQAGDVITQPWCTLAQVAQAQGVALPERNAIAATLLGELLLACAAFARDGFRDFALEWSRRDLMRGRGLRVSGAGVERTGTGEGIDASGALLLRTPRGIERVFAGDVSLRADDVT